MTCVLPHIDVQQLVTIALRHFRASDDETTPISKMLAWSDRLFTVPSIRSSSANRWPPCLAWVLVSHFSFGPRTYRPIEYHFLFLPIKVRCDRVFSICMGFVRSVFLILWTTCVWNSFGAFSLMGFLRILQNCESMFETFPGQRIYSHVGKLESPRRGWKYKPRA